MCEPCEGAPGSSIPAGSVVVKVVFCRGREREQPLVVFWPLQLKEQRQHPTRLLSASSLPLINTFTCEIKSGLVAVIEIYGDPKIYLL